MPTLQDSISGKFLEALSESEQIEPHTIEQLRVLLAAGGKLKADDFVKIFTAPADGEVK